MTTPETTIIPYKKNLREQVISVWERSARATHHFVTPADMDDYKVLVNEIDFEAFAVYCLMAQDKVIGILGVSDFRIDMLFMDPDFIGQGHGKKLMLFAMQDLQADKVDVNEQNTYAVNFYSKFGFSTYKRNEKDPAGKAYPILEMQVLKQKSK